MASQQGIRFSASAIEQAPEIVGGLEIFNASAAAPKVLVTELPRAAGEARALFRDEQKLEARASSGAVVHASLYDALAAKRDASEAAAKEAEKVRFLPTGLDAEEVAFLADVEGKRAEEATAALEQAAADKLSFEAAVAAAAAQRAARDDEARRRRTAAISTARPLDVAASASATVVESGGSGGATAAAGSKRAPPPRSRDDGVREDAGRGRASAPPAKRVHLPPPPLAPAPASRQRAAPTVVSEPPLAAPAPAAISSLGLDYDSDE
jgi:hypothetical protein